MSNIVPLNNVDHKDLRIVTRRAAEFGDNVRYAITCPWEFRSIQAHYPIVFSKDAKTGDFQSLAVFGFDEGENLFLDDDGWHASYVPMSVERQPFLIGFERAGDAEAGNPVIHIDMDSPRISTTDGERVFLEHGGLSEYLERINSLLDTLHKGLHAGKAFSDRLQEFGLLESFVLDVELEDGSQNRMAGFYSVNEDRLAQLDGEALGRLNEHGFLQAAYMVIASISNFRTLIDRRNERSRSDAAG